MNQQSSLELSDAQAAAVQKTPNRVTLESIKAKVSSVEFINPESVPHFTIAVVRLTNGFVILGQSAPADPKNFDAELGKKFAEEDALRKVWSLEGYLLCEKLGAPVETDKLNRDADQASGTN